MWDTCIRLPAGHRLRLEIASSAFPKFDVNLGTGGDMGTETEGVIATNRVWHTPDRPSRLLMRTRLVQQGLGRERCSARTVDAALPSAPQCSPARRSVTATEITSATLPTVVAGAEDGEPLGMAGQPYCFAILAGARLHLALARPRTWQAPHPGSWQPVTRAPTAARRDLAPRHPGADPAPHRPPGAIAGPLPARCPRTTRRPAAIRRPRSTPACRDQMGARHGAGCCGQGVRGRGVRGRALVSTWIGVIRGNLVSNNIFSIDFIDNIGEHSCMSRVELPGAHWQ